MLKRIIVLLFLFSLTSILSQSKPEYYYELSNSFGLDFDKSKPVLYVNVLRKINPDISLGMRAGLYTYHEQIVQNLENKFRPVYNTLPPGFYRVEFYNVKVRTFTYIVSLAGEYKINKQFSAGICAGIKNYLDEGYAATFSFGKSGNSAPLVVSVEDIRSNDNDKVISRLYFSLNAEYNLNRLSLGLFADNIYSAGFSIGISF